jgi:putative ABC transport system permease protein
MSDVQRVALAAVLLVVLLLVVTLVGRLGHSRDALVTVARAIVQLTLVGFVIRLVILTPALSPVYLTTMVGVAAWTSSRRLRSVHAAFSSAAFAITAGTAIVLAVVVASGALPRDTRDLVPFTAQVIGGSMTATTLAATRMRDDVLQGWDLVEAALAIGATGRQAVADIARTSASRALVPALDQTRNVGLVVLPGAYVGLLLAGASPAEAGRVQLLVLLGLLVAESVAAVIVTRLLAPALGGQKPRAAGEAALGSGGGSAARSP